MKDLSPYAQGALLGMFIGDALAMPVHWYYNTMALHMDYGEVNSYLKPKNPHPDSILHRSHYTPVSAKADILHDQRKYWGKAGIHYHQLLQAGENTLNIKIARELLKYLNTDEAYSAIVWLEKMADFLTTAGNHNDTYAEEYLRHFFHNYGKGLSLEMCGRQDEKHIGGFSLMLPVLLHYSNNPEKAELVALEHLKLTHGGETMEKWGRFLCKFILGLLNQQSTEEAFHTAKVSSNIELEYTDLTSLFDYSEETVVCRHFSSACYVDLSMPATLYLALKHKNSPEKGMIANTMCGGDNCGRGAVLGALFGAMHGPECWPDHWVDGLIHPPPANS